MRHTIAPGKWRERALFSVTDEHGTLRFQVPGGRIPAAPRGTWARIGMPYRQNPVRACDCHDPLNPWTFAATNI